MKKQTLDMTQLFGFSDIAGKVNINSPKLATRLGAKVGGEPTITEINFRDSTVSAQIGAKIGVPEP